MTTAPTTLAEIQKAAGYIEPALHALELIQGLTGNKDTGTALTLIGAVVKTLVTGVAHSVTPQQIIDDMTRLTTGLSANDAAADAAAAAKFRTP